VKAQNSLKSSAFSGRTPEHRWWGSGSWVWLVAFVLTTGACPGVGYAQRLGKTIGGGSFPARLQGFLDRPEQYTAPDIWQLYLDATRLPTYDPHDTLWEDSLAHGWSTLPITVLQPLVDTVARRHPLHPSLFEARRRIAQALGQAHVVERCAAQLRLLAQAVASTGTGESYDQAFRITHHHDIPHYLVAWGYEPLKTLHKPYGQSYYELVVCRHTATQHTRTYYFNLALPFGALRQPAR
jgi:hypothetical protein